MRRIAAFWRRVPLRLSSLRVPPQSTLSVSGLKCTNGLLFNISQFENQGLRTGTSYALSNLGANIKRVRERIAEQQAKDTEVYTERDAGIFTVVEDPSINRIQILFPSKPDKDTCRTMRRWGWVFSRTNSAWQRQLNNAGRASAQIVEKQLKGDNR